MARGIFLVAAGLVFAAPLGAAPLTVRVVDSSGHPVRDAVVTLYPSGPAARAPKPAGRYVVSQQNLQFHPFLTIIPVGADVSFPNFDNTKHHVYSFSPAKRFELKLFAKDQSRTVHFDKAGVVALGCNIHDQMTAFIVVTDSAWTERTNAQGIVTFNDAPNAPGRLTVWDAYLRAPGGMLQQPVAPGQRTASFAVRLRPPPAAMPMSMDY
jgi:plastocyanin